MSVAKLTVSIEGLAEILAMRDFVVAFVVAFVVVLQLFFQQYKFMLRFENIEDTELPETAENKMFSFADFLREAVEPVILFGSCQATEVALVVDTGAPRMGRRYMK
jgi:hypothetical protein